LASVAEAHIRLRHELKNGRYDWYRPIHGTSVQDSMIIANRELQEVVDNGGLVRGVTNNKNKKDGKILTFQANDSLNYLLFPKERVSESINDKGDPYVEYTYGEENVKREPVIWIKNSANSYRYGRVLKKEIYI
jgi:hypothetical protein